MEKSSKEFPWANIWMMAFAAAGIWLAWPRVQHLEHVPIDTIIPMALVFLVGFFRIPISLFYEPESGQHPTLNDMVRLYLNALKQVLGQRWLLRVFGFVLVLRLLDGLAGSWLDYSRIANLHMRSLPGIWMPSFPSMETLSLVLPQHFPSAVGRSIGEFLPGMGFASSGFAVVFPAIGLLAFVIWLSVGLRAQPDDPQFARRHRLIYWMLVPAVLMCVASLILASVEQRLLSAMAFTVPQPPIEYTGYVTVAEAGAAVSVVVRALFRGVLIAGLAGSLLRMKRGGTITADSFRRETLRYLLPVEGVYLILALVCLAMYLPSGFPATMSFARYGVSTGSSPYLARMIWHLMNVIGMLAVLAPFAVVVKGTGAWQGIRNGLGDWLAHAGDILSFLALGLTFTTLVFLWSNLVSVVLGPHDFTSFAVPPMPVDWLRVAVQSLLGVFTAVVMVVAVWEFYWRITPHEAPEAAVSAAHEPGI